MSFGGLAHADIEIGLVAPLTGPLAAEGTLAAQAGSDVVEAINQAGGLRGTRVSLRVEDDQCHPGLSREKAETLIRRRIVAAVGHCRVVAREVRDIYEQARIPLIVPNASFTDLGRTPSWFVLHLGARADRMAEAAVRLIQKRGIGSRLGAISDGSPFASELISELRSRSRTPFAYSLDLRESGAAALADLQRRNPAEALFFAVANPDTILAHLQTVNGIPAILTGLPTSSDVSWQRFWAALGSDAYRIHVVALNQATPKSPLGNEVFRRWIERARSEGRRSTAPPDAYATFVAAFELLAGVLTDYPADGVAIAQALRQRTRPTILGELRSREPGEIQLNYSALHGAEDQWTPAGASPPSQPTPGIAPPPPPPKTKAKPPPPTTPTDGKFAAYWNAWFERDRSIASRLEINNDYRFVLDLSRYQRRPEASAAVSAEARTILESAKRSATFTVRVLFAGGPVRVKGTQDVAASRTLEVDVSRLYRTDLDSKELDAWRKADLDTRVYVNKASAGQIAFDVTAVNEGCGAVAVSVWDGPGLRPLDHLTYEYAVGDPRNCPNHDRLIAGIGMVLAITSVLEGGEPEKADTALHIFELPQGPRDQGSVVWYVDRTEFEAAQQSGTTAGVYAWQTQSSLKQYVQMPSQLPAKLQAARDAAAKGEEWPYASVAEDLRKKLFSVENEKLFGENARRAQAALERLVNESSRPPVIIARLAASADALDYLPLGLLAARAEKPFLRKSFVTVQPLRRERFYQGKACVDPWTLGIPERLDGIDQKLQQELADFALDTPAWPHAWAREIKQLRQSFRQGESPPGASAAAAAPGSIRGEGIVLLAHHTDGNLWFDRAIDSVAQEDFQRALRRGSVALISACSVGGGGPLAYNLIERLNARNVDAMIVSPFPVRADFGARLALHFVREIDDARRKRLTPTIAELYAAAWDRTAKHFETSKRDLHDMGLEFVILGDPSIRLCAN
jgi:branched-chain amino acid transport system substrate-binding protein